MNKLTPPERQRLRDRAMQLAFGHESQSAPNLRRGAIRKSPSSKPPGPLAIMAGSVNDGEDMDGLSLYVATDSIREPERI